MDFEWDRDKAASNLKKHHIDFADAVTVFDDLNTITIDDPNYDELRFAVCVHRFKVHRSGLPVFRGVYKSWQHCFQLPILNTLIQFYFYSASLRAYESMVQVGPELEPLNLEP